MIETCEVAISNSDKKMLCDKEDYLRFCYEIGFVPLFLSGRGYVHFYQRKKNNCFHKFVMSYPDCEVDHINGDPLDNRKCNLRLVTHKQNCRNRKTQRNNTSGEIGISHEKNAWAARIGIDGKNIYLGRFNTIEEAIEVRKQAESTYWGAVR